MGEGRHRNSGQAVLEPVVSSFSFSLPSTTAPCNFVLCCVQTQTPPKLFCVSRGRWSSRERMSLPAKGGAGRGAERRGRTRTVSATLSCWRARQQSPNTSQSRYLRLRLMLQDKQTSLFQTQSGSPLPDRFPPGPWGRWVCARELFTRMVLWTWALLVQSYTVLGACPSGAGFKSPRCSIWGSSPFLLRKKFQVLTGGHFQGWGLRLDCVPASPTRFHLGLLSSPHV